ncbi:MAG: hypothetical protein RLO46_13375 [Pseudomonadales bacterium]
MKRYIRPLFVALLIGTGAAALAAPASMEDMAAVMQRIQQTEDPAERERLLEQHLEQMHKHMEQMHSQMAQMHEEMGQMMGHMNAQRRETKRIHDHRKLK